MKPKRHTHGGKRTPAPGKTVGRPRKSEQIRKHFSLTLDPETVARLLDATRAAAGDDKITRSDAVMRAVSDWLAWHDAQAPEPAAVAAPVAPVVDAAPGPQVGDVLPSGAVVVEVTDRGIVYQKPRSPIAAALHSAASDAQAKRKAAEAQAAAGSLDAASAELAQFQADLSAEDQV